MTTSTAERLVKSTDRVRDLGEVFTPTPTVNAMLDLLPGEIWEPHPAPTFLEPSCGDGNFLVAVLSRKLERIAQHHAASSLPAGTSVEAAHFHSLEAMSSIYGVDISPENILGGTPGHGVGARTRLLNLFLEWSYREFGKKLTARSSVRRSAEWIIGRNLVIGDTLATTPAGHFPGHDDLSLIEYEWDPANLSVSAWSTSLGTVLHDARSKSTGVISLFGPPAPHLLWKGKATRLGTTNLEKSGG